jgi:2'-5' RNA ligase
MAVQLGDPTGSSIAMQAALAAALQAAGLYEPEHRRWLPHVTIGRSRAPVARPVALPDVEPVEFLPPSVTVYRSHPGSRYEALSRHDLGGDASHSR